LIGSFLLVLKVLTCSMAGDKYAKTITEELGRPK
jgi:hypothetical protein